MLVYAIVAEGKWTFMGARNLQFVETDPLAFIPWTDTWSVTLGKDGIIVQLVPAGVYLSIPNQDTILLPWKLDKETNCFICIIPA